MEYLSSQCCVCLELTSDAERITNWDRKNSQWIVKLQNVVPEVVWMEYYTICKSCTYNLDVAHDFRALCLEAHERITDQTKILKDGSETHNASLFDKNGLAYDTASYPQTIQRNEEIKVEVTQPEMEPLEDTKIDIELMEFPEEVKTQATQSFEQVKIEPTQLSDETDTESGTKIDQFSCEMCNLKMETAKQVVEHCVTEHLMIQKAVKPYICDQCGCRFVCLSKLKEHKKYHTGIRDQVCKTCGKGFVVKKHLKLHEYTHLNRRDYKCDICGKTFKTSNCLYSHKWLVHTNFSEWKHHCEMCDRWFPYKSYYEEHVRKHAGIKPFACDLCDKSYVSQGELRAHQRYHFKKYDCEVCQIGFRDKDKYDKHMQKHTQKHTVVVPDCHLCSMKFTNQIYLRQHLESVHGVREDEGSVKSETMQ